MTYSTIKPLSKAQKTKRTKARKADPLRQAKKVVRPVEWIKKFDDGREVLNLKTPRGVTEYRHRTEAMCVRQGWLCGCGCGGLISMVTDNPKHRATFDHENGRGSGGSIQDDRIVLPDGTLQNRALAFNCNIRKGSKRGYGA